MFIVVWDFGLIFTELTAQLVSRGFVLCLYGNAGVLQLQIVCTSLHCSPSFCEKLKFHSLTWVLNIESCQRLFMAEMPVSEGRPSNYDTGAQVERNHYYCFYFCLDLYWGKGMYYYTVYHHSVGSFKSFLFEVILWNFADNTCVFMWKCFLSQKLNILYFSNIGSSYSWSILRS